MIQSQPLSGRRIVLTRNVEGASRLAGRLKALGAEILEIPLIEVRFDIDGESAVEIFKEFASYEWLIFTSRNGVKHFFNAFLKAYDDIRSLGFVRIAVVGKGTVEALGEYHLRADLVAPSATADDLAKALEDEETLDNLKVLVITGNRNKEDLVKRLWEDRAIVDSLRVYSTHFCDLEGNEEASRFRKEGADALVFASASSVEAFGEQAKHLQLEKGAKVPALCSFGPTTSERMKKAGIPVAVEASDPGLDGMVAALVDYFSGKA
ncbi:uroporphyrinogen-III synthase [Puniceicoccales bacterium CK1056]|uniref:Uroporphyrinogen-III synthase n=1 Tax=Oceanipulchritudo coccoides TaxID=2706888 RepID=A0A6B2M128_9BACT|nr:uroporphyrinogen-III synthase [Oceanipulchritudo coccoides]NDV61757.1 uroporphyrinogen-III synthase [Oceanipulchritudo coccoides]